MRWAALNLQMFVVAGEEGCLIWGTGESVRYGQTTYFSFCDVLYSFGAAHFWSGSAKLKGLVRCD